jgi:UDP-glucuronate decarboxylase
VHRGEKSMCDGYITKAREALGWEPKVKLEEGLKDTIAYFDRLLSAGAR